MNARQELNCEKVWVERICGRCRGADSECPTCWGQGSVVYPDDVELRNDGPERNAGVARGKEQ